MQVLIEIILPLLSWEGKEQVLEFWWKKKGIKKQVYREDGGGGSGAVLIRRWPLPGCRMLAKNRLIWTQKLLLRRHLQEF
jgi:hypothetical protein